MREEINRKKLRQKEERSSHKDTGHNKNFGGKIDVSQIQQKLSVNNEVLNVELLRLLKS